LESERVTVIKLGGSVITKKEQAFTPNQRNIRNLATALARYRGKIVIVHGAGSYGHPLAKHYGLKTKPTKIDGIGVTLTRLAVQILHLDVVMSLEKAGLPTYSLPPVSLLDINGAKVIRVELLESILSSGLIPVTFGDVLSTSRGSFVISGDRLATLLAGKLRPNRVVFALDVDGVYDSNPKDGTLITELQSGMKYKSIGLAKWTDVTGGISGKIDEAQKIARKGVDVIFVNGAKPERVLKALKGERVLGSLLRGV
jgi:isopentenyl phosphate kinase